MRDTDYLEYDDLGLKEVRCMVCKKPVAKRTYVQMDKRDGSGEPVRVMTMKRLPQWRQVRYNVTMDNGVKGYIDAIVCASCQVKTIDQDAVFAQAVKGWELGLRNKYTENHVIEEKMASMSRITLDRKEPVKKEVIVRELPDDIMTG